MTDWPGAGTRRLEPANVGARIDEADDVGTTVTCYVTEESRMLIDSPAPSK
jgi:hypothetical protein